IDQVVRGEDVFAHQAARKVVPAHAAWTMKGIEAHGCGLGDWAKRMSGTSGEWDAHGPVENDFETMVYHGGRARRLAPRSPLLLPERVPVAIRLEFDQAVCPAVLRRVFLCQGFGLSSGCSPGVSVDASSPSSFACGISQLSISACASSRPTRFIAEKSCTVNSPR